MARLIVRDLDPELVARLKTARRRNTADQLKPSTAKFCARRLHWSRDDRSRSSLRKCV
jgi:hypothetical protein